MSVSGPSNSQWRRRIGEISSGLDPVVYFMLSVSSTVLYLAQVLSTGLQAPLLLLICSFFPLSTLFKFVKKFEEALNYPSAPALVELGSSANLDSVDTTSEETPIHRVHQALRNTLSGKDRDLQVQGNIFNYFLTKTNTLDFFGISIILLCYSVT